MKLRLIPIIASIALVLSSCGGYEAAQKAYNLGEYTKAAELFDGAQKKEQNSVRKAEECFLLGECYRKLGLHSKAASAYQRAVRLKYPDDEAMLRLADSYRYIGKFDEARDVYSAYYERHKTDLRTGVGRESARMAEGVWKELSSIKDKGDKNDSGYVVKPFRELNSKYSDFCPVFVGEGYDIVYFTSSRMEKKKKRASKITGQGGSTIYMSKVDGRGKWTIPAPLDEPFGKSGNDDGVANVSSDGRTMVFTRCPLNGQEGSPVHAYEIRREGGRWSDPVRILPGSDSTMMVAHPALSPDGQVLYFVSDKEGGFGGLDIWKSLRNVDGSWGPAQNLGPFVNSAGDEMFPSVRENGTLYFSSNGHPGFGGLDIYKAVEADGGRYVVSNMGLPINSAGDDFGITFMGSAEEGLFSSNRGNVKGYDDIYSFSLPPVILTIEARVGQSGKKAFADGNTKPRNTVLRPSPSFASDSEGQTANTASVSKDQPADEKVETNTEAAAQPSTSDQQTATNLSSDKSSKSSTKTASASKSSTPTSSKTKGSTTTKKTVTSSTKKTTASTTKKKTTSASTTQTKKTTATAKPKTATAQSQTTAKTADSKSSSTKAKAPSSSSKSSTSTSKKKKTAKKFVPIPDAFVRIVGSDGTNVKLPVNEKGVITFVAEKDVRYIIMTGAPGYANARAEVSTEGLNKTQTLKLTSLLDKVE